MQHSNAQSIQMPPIPSCEVERLQELKSFNIIGAEEQEDFEFLTKLAAEICGTKVSLISLITEDKQWFLSHHGIDTTETPREHAFCAHAINEPDQLFIIEDSRKDERFKNNPLVTGDPHIIFYAGVPLVSENNYALGMLCVIDDTPRKLNDQQLNSLQLLAKQVIQLLELRKKTQDLQQKNDELEKKDDLLEITQSANKIGAWELDLETGQTYWSDEVYNIYELEKGFEHNKAKALEFFHPADRKIISDALENSLETGATFDITARLITANNNMRWVRSNARLRTNREGKQSLIGSFQDITETKRNELELSSERTRINNILNGTNIGHWEWNVQTGETVFNERWAEIVGYSLEELEPVSIDTWMNLAHPDDLDESGRLLNLCFEKKAEFYEFEARMKHKDGYWVWVYDRGKVFSWTDDGKPLMMYGTHQDITRRKSYEEQLKVSEKAFRGNFENAAIGMAMLDKKGRWLKANERVCDILGYSEDELFELTFQDLTYPDDLDSDLQLLDELVSGKRDYYHMEKRYYHKDGHIVYAILAASVVRDPEENILYFISQIIDITNLKNAEKNLSSALAKNRATMNASTQVAIISTDLNGVITEFNEGAERMLGYEASDLVGRFTPQIIHIEDEVLAEGESIFEEFGEKVEGFEIFIHKAKDGVPYTKEWTLKRKNGSTVPVLLSMTAIIQEDEITGYLGIATNISKLKKAEREINSILCITENQNERLQNFSRIVTHNLRSHAGGIFGMLEVLKFENPEAYSNEYVQLLEKGVENLKETIEHLTELVKNDFAEENDFKQVELRGYVERNKNSVITLALKHDVEVINNVDEQLKVSVIPGYLDSIAMNFITNAIKYSDPAKDSFVKIEAEAEGDFVVLKISDNGLGIDLDENGKDLFGMYKTFHERDDARGVGLYITKNQIESMGGRVEVESEPGAGTSFHVYLQGARNQSTVEVKAEKTPEMNKKS